MNHVTLQCPANFLHFLQSENIGSPDGDPINRLADQWVCMLCYKTFGRKYHVKRHIRTVHGRNNDENELYNNTFDTVTGKASAQSSEDTDSTETGLESVETTYHEQLDDFDAEPPSSPQLMASPGSSVTNPVSVVGDPDKETRDLSRLESILEDMMHASAASQLELKYLSGEEDTNADSDLSTDSESDSDSDELPLHAYLESSSESDSEDDERVCIDDADDSLPLYKNAPFTVQEHANAVLGYATRYNTSQEELKDMIKLINLHLPKENNAAKTVQQLNKMFGNDGEDFVVNIFEYCGKCNALWPSDQPDVFRCSTENCHE